MTDEVLDTTNLTVHQAIAAVMADIGPVGKNAKVEAKMGGYKYQGIDAIVNAAQEIMARYRLILLPHEVLSVDYSDTNTSGGKVMTVVRVRVRFRWYGPTGDYVEVETLGESFDSGDKGTAKAQTVAYRVCIKETLMIAPGTDGDPDADVYEREHRRPSRQQEPPPDPDNPEWESWIASPHTAQEIRAAWADANKACSRSQMDRLKNQLAAAVEAEKKAAPIDTPSDQGTLTGKEDEPPM